MVWLSDLTRPFVVVLIRDRGHPRPRRAGPTSAWRVRAATRSTPACAPARAEGIAVDGPFDDGPPVGYWAILHDPDGHHLELAFGQQVDATVAAAGPETRAPGTVSVGRR